jgi:hypothetical protein
LTLRAVLAKAPGPRRWVLASIFPGQVLYFTRQQRARRLGPVLAWKRPRHSATASARRFRNRCFEHCMTSTIPAAAGSPGDPLASTQHALSGAAPVASGAAIRTGILWMLVATCLFVCQDSTARILLKAYPAMEIAFARYFVHMVLVSAFITWRDPRLMISRRPVLQSCGRVFSWARPCLGCSRLRSCHLSTFPPLCGDARSRRRALGLHSP